MFDQSVFRKLFYKSVFIGSAVSSFVLTAYFIHRRVKAAQPPKTSLEVLNKEFHRQYTKAHENVWRSATKNGSVIIAKGSQLTLSHKGTDYLFPKAIPQAYHDLKRIAHIPLTIYLLLSNDSTTLTNDTLQQYLQHLNSVQVPDSLGSKEKDSAHRIISKSQKILRKKLDKKDSVGRNMLTHFCRSLANDLSVLLEAAAITQLNEMDEIIQGWMDEHCIDRRDPKLKILLIGPRTGRQNNLQSTYFERLLGSERRRNIVYIEELFNDEAKAKSIFSKWFLDEELSASFFNDYDRMHRDLLMSEHAQKQIDQLIPL